MRNSRYAVEIEEIRQAKKLEDKIDKIAILICSGFTNHLGAIDRKQDKQDKQLNRIRKKLNVITWFVLALLVGALGSNQISLLAIIKFIQGIF